MSTRLDDRPAALPSRSGRRRARSASLVDREYGAARDEVLRTVRGKLRAAGVLLDESDLEAAYNQAWHALYLKLADGEEIENRVGLLVTIVHRRALDDHRSMHVDRRTELDPETAAPLHDLEQRLDDQHQLRAFRAGMRERLSGRDLQAATLCYLHERTRPEAAEIMGLSPRRMEKVMDRVSKRINELARDVQGDWCATQRSLIQAYALGVLDPEGERHQLAVDHLRDCPGCRRRVLTLRGLSAVAPPVPLLLGAGGIAGVGAGAGAGGPSTAGGGAGESVAAPAKAGVGIGGTNLVVAGIVAAVIAVVAAVAAVALIGGGSDDPPARTAPAAGATSSGAAGPGAGGASGGASSSGASSSGAASSRGSSSSSRGSAADRSSSAARARTARRQAARRQAARARAASAAGTTGATGATAGSTGGARAAGTTGTGTSTGTGSSSSAPTAPPASTPPATSATPTAPSTTTSERSSPAPTSKSAPKVATDGAEEFDLR